MAKTPDSQLRAIRNYDAKREGVAITFRLSKAEIADLDKARGELTRSAFAKRATLQALKLP